MEFQPWMEWLVPVLCALLTGTGLWAFLSARATAKATREGAALYPAPPEANTADWNALASYWTAEMKALRETSTNLEVRVLFLERQREEDLQHIEDLEQHIWNQLPPPPPIRRKTQAP